MTLSPRNVLLKDDRICVLRSPTCSDAEDLIEYVKITSGETDYLVKYPDEVTITPEEERNYIEKLNADPRQAMILAEVDGQLAGNCTFHPVGGRARNYHRCSIGIALYEKFWGLGIGSALLDLLLEEAAKCGFEQAELEVRARNERAIALYKKKGFTETGRIPHAAKHRDGSYDDDLILVKML